MALWTQAQQLKGDALQQIQNIYADQSFPIEVRHFLASWLEEKMWMEIDNDSPQRDVYMLELFNSFLAEIERKADELNSPDLFLAKMKLKNTASYFQTRYRDNPQQLFRIIRNCLNTEINLLSESQGVPPRMFGQGGMMPFIQDQIMSEIAKQLQILRNRTIETGEDLRALELEQESYALQYHDGVKINTQLQHLATQVQTPQITDMQNKLRRNKEVLDPTLQQKMIALIQMRLSLGDKLNETITVYLSTLQSRVLDEELIRWKREQQLAGNGAHFVSNLDSIQEWCETLAEIIWMNRQQVKELGLLKQKVHLEPQGVVDLLPTLNSHITQLLSSLVTSTFIIEKQPPQVMKTNTRFTSTVRLLVGGKLNVHMSSPQVEVSIISEAQANALLQNDRSNRPTDAHAARNEVSGEILNNTGRMDYVQQSRQLTVQFRNMQLKKIKRAEKKGTESVMDEKFSLLFRTHFSVGNGELVFQVWTLSLPVVVIVHGNQEPHAWATVTWDNAFAEPGRTPFAVPDKVPWSQVANALNCKFQSVTGRGLTEDNLKFLAEKAFRLTQSGDFSQLPLSWSLFCKEPLPDRTFTFWEWFYALMKLTKEHLKGPWADGSIIGFVRKKQAEEMLSTMPIGTFLLRFSDSEPGGVTIAWVGDHSEVFMLLPFTCKDFGIRSLADRISDLPHLVNLYPDIPKEQVFSKYYSPPVTGDPPKGGYVKPVLITHVPGHGAFYSSPSTPHAAPQPLSPDNNRDSEMAGLEFGCDFYGEDMDGFFEDIKIFPSE